MVTFEILVVDDDDGRIVEAGISSREGLRSISGIPGGGAPPREGLWSHNIRHPFHATWCSCPPNASPS